MSRARSSEWPWSGGLASEKAGISVGDMIHVTGSKEEKNLKVVGVFDSGGEEDDLIYVTVDTAQALGGLEGKIDSIEVSALTTPDNELAEKAARDPGSLPYRSMKPGTARLMSAPSAIRSRRWLRIPSPPQSARLRIPKARSWKRPSS